MTYIVFFMPNTGDKKMEASKLVLVCTVQYAVEEVTGKGMKSEHRYTVKE